MRHFHLHCPPSHRGPTPGVPEIDTNPLSHFRNRPHSLPESLPNRLNFSHLAPSEIPKTLFKTRSISHTAPFKRYRNSLADQQHPLPRPFLASGVPINAYDFKTAYRK